MGFFAKLFGPKQDPMEWVARGAKIVDVRTTGEFASGHPAKAINVPLNSIATLPKKIKDKDAEIVLCCASGMRASAAKQNLEKMGYTKVINAGSWTKLRTLAGAAMLGLTFSATTACGQATETASTQETARSAQPENLDVAAFKAAKEGHVLVDVRTDAEVAEGMIEGAAHVDFNSADFAAQMEATYGGDKDQAIYLYCRSGGRSGRALSQLKQAGFTNVHHLVGGFMAWSASEAFVKP
jgi:rhodanese-related sulfurtransferase